MAMRTGDLLRRKLSVERLERRDMLAGFSATLDAQGVLKITGTEANDDMFLVNNGSKLYIYGQAQQFNVSQVKQISIDGLGGNDVIRLDSQVIGGMQAIYAPTVINGGAGNDIILGAQGDDVIFGGDGNDVLFGLNCNDYLDGGLGNDVLYGGNGVDTLAGDKGNDILLGEAGTDFLTGGDGSDVLYGGTDTDWLDGGRDYDWLFGEAGYDYLFDTNSNYITDSTGQVLQTHYGWFDMNLSDDLLRSIARSTYRDGDMSRTDMIAIYGAVGRDGVVSATELADLRAIVGSGSTVIMADYVKVLATKIAAGDAGNALFQGGALGNLTGGSSAAQLNKLVGKWFYGSDRPNTTIGGTTYAYNYAQGSLFVGGAAFNDLRQGYVGDCYFLAGLGAAALKTPATIQNMFVDNGDGTFTVRFFNNGKADYVTVDRYLPVDSNGRFVFAGAGLRASTATNELWVALAEKAYAQLNGSGWLRGPSGANSYSSIAAGYMADAFEQITGRDSSLGNSINLASIINAFNSGALVGFASKFSGPVSQGVVRGHAYVMTAYNAATQTVTLFNPWGEGGSTPATLTMNITQLQANFLYFDRTI
ncbi:MAG: hypothetical protein JNM18_09125 [Planctomycetaceae bacterium]|nr:hypothetical protein [Planctomycetaceae bacterium]